VTSRVVTNRDLAASRCRVEERPHRERHERIAEHADEEPFEDKGIRCVQEACAEASNQRSVHRASNRCGRRSELLSTPEGPRTCGSYDTIEQAVGDVRREFSESLSTTSCRHPGNQRRLH
jgi:hypothetical protein